MDIFAFNATDLMSFFLTFFRVSIIVFLLPFYGGESIPAQVKGALCLVLAFALWPRLSFAGSYFPAHPLGIGLLLLGEAILGLMLGLCVHFVFAAIQTAGEFMGYQMGFTMVTVMDPMSGSQTSITSHILYMVAMLIFLSLDGHLHLLKAVSLTFSLVPPGGLLVSGKTALDMIALSGTMFLMALKIAAPILASLFMVELGLALMARAAPQMNLMMIGFPIKIGVGFAFMTLLFSILGMYMEDFIIGMGPMFAKLLSAVGR